MPKSRVFELAAVVLIGRDFTYRHWLVLWVRSAYADGLNGLAVGPINRLIEKELHVQVFVRDNNVTPRPLRLALIYE